MSRSTPSITALLVAAALAPLLLLGCVSTSAAPAELAPASCEIDPGVPGVWTSSRWSQVGPASMRFDLRCDCTYTSRVRVLLTSIRERGHYWIEDGALVLTRANGELTRWPYRLEGGALVLEEAPGEEHTYRRKAQVDCAAS